MTQQEADDPEWPANDDDSGPDFDFFGEWEGGDKAFAPPEPDCSWSDPAWSHPCWARSREDFTVDGTEQEQDAWRSEEEICSVQERHRSGSSLPLSLRLADMRRVGPSVLIGFSYEQRPS